MCEKKPNIVKEIFNVSKTTSIDFVQLNFYW